MTKARRKVKLKMGRNRSWPELCVLCTRPATTHDNVLINGDKVPYCGECLSKVNRLRSWMDNTFGIALIIGGIVAILGPVAIVDQEGWSSLFRSTTCLRVLGGGMIVGLLIFAILHILILLLRLLLRGKLAKPGVKSIDVKEAGIIGLQFSNPAYAEMFRELNHEIVIE